MSLANLLYRFLTPEWLSAIGTVAAAVIALAFGLQDKIKSIVYRPKLDLDCSLNAPNVRKTHWGHDPDDAVWYFRGTVKNKGNLDARDVSVFVASVDEIENGKAYPVKRFSPLFLRWAYFKTPVMDCIPPEIPRFCDIFHITSPYCRQAVNGGEDLPGVEQFHSVIALDVEAIPNDKSNLLRAGHYVLTLKIGGSNTNWRTKKIRVNFDGEWCPTEEEQMRHLKISTV